MNKITKGISAVVAGVSLIASGAAGAMMTMEPDVVNHTIIQQEVVKVPVEVEKIVNQTVEVPVDNGNLGIVLDHIYDNNGDISYLTDDLDDDEVDEIVDRIIFVNDIKKLAVDEVKKNLFDELDREDFNSTVTFDDDDLERLHIHDDDDEIIVDDIDFDDGDADLIVSGTFEQDDVKYDFNATVQIRDSEIDEIDSIDTALN